MAFHLVWLTTELVAHMKQGKGGAPTSITQPGTTHI